MLHAVRWTLARGDAATYADYCLLTHAKLHWLSRAARDDPFGTAGHVVWVDAGLYRYPKHVVGMNPHALGCYAAAQFSTEQAVLTMLAAEAADGFELVPTENYRYIARKMLNCP